jgi:hypothetical protein
MQWQRRVHSSGGRTLFRPIAYDLKLKAPAEQKEILFMSGQRFGELRRERQIRRTREGTLPCSERSQARTAAGGFRVRGERDSRTGAEPPDQISVGADGTGHVAFTPPED